MMITLQGEDPQFDQYLRGTFSRTERALPVRSLNVASNRESVTFEIRSVAECRTVSLWRVWLEAVRPWTYILSMGPLWATWMVCLDTNRTAIHGIWVGLSALSVLFLHSAANLLNDYFDHVRGVDRMNPRSGTRVIQKGWLAAHHVLKAGYFCAIVAILFSAPVVTNRFSVLWFVALVTGVLVLEHSSNRFDLKYRKAGEGILFILFGPLLTMSFAFVATGTWLASSGWLGLWTGAAAAHIYFLRSLENVMVDEQAGSLTLAARAGFDRAKAVASYFGLARLAALLLLGLWGGQFWLACVLFVGECFGQWLLLRRLMRSSSPLSSEMKRLHTLAWQSYLALLILLTVTAVLV